MALFMNLAMVCIQVTMIVLMAIRVMNNRMIYNEHMAIQKNFVGNMVILLWFLFDAIGNLIQMYGGTHLLEWSQAISNDVQMHHIAYQTESIEQHNKANKDNLNYKLGYLKMEFLKLPKEITMDERCL